jgi:hypothetical protein
MKVDEISQQKRVSEIEDLIPEVREIERRRRKNLAAWTAVVVVMAAALVLLSLYSIGETPFSRGTSASGIATKTLPSPPATGPSNLRGALGGAGCPTPSECWVVGEQGGLNFSPLTERWTDGRWRIVPSPSTTGVSLQAVACPVVSSCIAVGNVGNPLGGAIAEEWSGHSWRPEDNPLLSWPSGVSCLQRNECVAVGENLGGPQALASNWNGSNWRMLNVPNTQTANFLGVNCMTTTSCWFVGYGQNRIGIESNYAIAERWTRGRWTVDRIDAPRGGSILQLESVSCVGSSFCVAVGGNDVRPVSAIWNGTSWKLVRMPAVGPEESDSLLPGGLASVACSSASDCLAVGGDLMDRFNGTSWSPVVVRTPRGLSGIYLNGVSVIQGSDFLVVGSNSFGIGVDGELVVIEEYDGRSLTVLQD